MDESVVLLGVAAPQLAVDAISPCACKLGGRPTWFHEEVEKDEALQCPKCKRRLLLVAQVYAPVDVDRTLYVFGCNSAACIGVTGSWRVFRDQDTVKKQPEVVQDVTTEEVAPKAAPSGWEDGDNDSDDWSDDDDATTGNTPAVPTASGLDALEALLQQRDDTLAKPVTKVHVPAPVQKKVSSVPASSESTKDSFAAVAVDVIEEPYEDYTTEHDYSHENELLEAYMHQEEEEKSADVEVLRNLLANTKVSSASTSAAASSSSTGESYERTPAQEKHFLRFQKRLNRCPQQVLRYDYGGTPLWPKPAPRSLKIPRCPCGLERVFEMQLLPTVNYVLHVDDHAIAHRAASEVNATAVKQGTGMDWSTVLIYSCPQSCSQSHEETALVLPP